MHARPLALVLALVGAMVPSPARAEAPGAPLGLEDALRLALANNERAAKVPLRVTAAEGALDKARSAFLPTLQGTGVGTLQPVDAKTTRPLSGAAALSLTQPLLNLSAFPLYSQAKYALESEKFGSMQDKRVLLFDTARAFLVVLTAEGLAQAATSRLDRAREAQKNAVSRSGAGLSSSNDVTRALIDIATAARDLANAQGNVDKAYLQLAFLLGRPVAGPLAPPERTSRAAQEGAIGGDDTVRAAEGRRADVLSAQQKTESLRAFAREPLYRLAPTLSVNGQVKATIDPIPPDTGHSEQVQLTLTWNIYDAGVRYADRRVRLAQAESQALDEKALRRSIATDVGLAAVALRTSRDLYRIAGEAVDAAKKNTAETQILYQQGLARAIEVTDANSTRYEAEVNRESAKLAMQQAYLDLRFATGLDPLDAGPAGAPKGGAE